MRLFGHRIRILHWCTHQKITDALAQMELTASQGRIMGYLAHQKTPPCARDIEETFQLSHPTVSGILSRLEKKGFIAFTADEEDRRCKRICIQPKGQELTALMERTILNTEHRLVQGFTPEEQAQFEALLERAILNMGGHPCHQIPKEETK